MSGCQNKVCVVKKRNQDCVGEIIPICPAHKPEPDEAARSARTTGSLTAPHGQKESGPTDVQMECPCSELGQTREKLAAAYVKLSGKKIHASDCATSNAPAMEPGTCDCTIQEYRPGNDDLCVICSKPFGESLRYELEDSEDWGHWHCIMNAKPIPKCKKL